MPAGLGGLSTAAVASGTVDVVLPPAHGGTTAAAANALPVVTVEAPAVQVELLDWLAVMQRRRPAAKR